VSAAREFGDDTSPYTFVADAAVALGRVFNALAYGGRDGPSGMTAGAVP